MPNWTRFLTQYVTYDSVKVVSTRSVKLGLLSRGMMIWVFAYIFLFQCMYKHRHYVKSRPVGLGRLQLQRPTKDHCNPMHPGCESDFTPMDELPYCDVYEGNETDFTGRQQPCIYMDEKQMNPTGRQHYHMLIPTRISFMDQVATNKCKADNYKHCTNVYDFPEGKKPEPTFIADLDRFTLLIDHAFILPFEDVEQGAPVANGGANDFQGYVEVCETISELKRTGCKEVPIPCFSGCDYKAEGRRLADYTLLEGDSEGMPNMRRLADSESPDFFSIKVGDIIPMGELLRLAGIDLNNATSRLGESRRSEGFVIQIDVDYRNVDPYAFMSPWKTGPVKYVYRVGMLPMETYKETSQELLDDGERRILHDWHGVFVKVKLGGSIQYFFWPQLLILLTTSLGLLAAADSVIFYYACYVWKHSKEFYGCKYDKSVNLNVGEYFLLDCTRKALQDDAEENNSTWSTFIKDMEVSVEDKPDRIDFVSQFMNSDGEALQSAADVLVALFKRLDKAEQDQLTDEITEMQHDRITTRNELMRLRSEVLFIPSPTGGRNPLSGQYLTLADESAAVPESPNRSGVSGRPS